MLHVWFHEQAEGKDFKYAVIVARAHGRWVYCKHKERDTLEFPGGHREQGEDIDDTARRELYEETGAAEFSLRRICPYSVTDDSGALPETYGMLYYAEITRFGTLPVFEIERVELHEGAPRCWTYPTVQPILTAHVAEVMGLNWDENHRMTEGNPMTDITVRRAEMADIADISRVFAGSWRVAYRGIVDAAYLSQISDDRWVQPLTAELPEKQLDGFVACCGKETIGAVLTRRSKVTEYPDDGEIVAIYTHPDWFGKGVGQALLDAAFIHLRAEGFTHCVLDVLENNQRAKRFYIKNGFVFTGQTQELTLGEPVRCEIMRASLVK